MGLRYCMCVLHVPDQPLLYGLGASTLQYPHKTCVCVFIEQSTHAHILDIHIHINKKSPRSLNLVAHMCEVCYTTHTHTHAHALTHIGGVLQH